MYLFIIRCKRRVKKKVTLNLQAAHWNVHINFPYTALLFSMLKFLHSSNVTHVQTPNAYTEMPIPPNVK